MEGDEKIDFGWSLIVFKSKNADVGQCSILKEICLFSDEELMTSNLLKTKDVICIISFPEVDYRHEIKLSHLETAFKTYYDMFQEKVNNELELLELYKNGGGPTFE